MGQTNPGDEDRPDEATGVTMADEPAAQERPESETGVPGQTPDSEDARPGDGPAPAGQQDKPVRGFRRRRSFWKEVPVLVVIALILAMVIKTYALQAFFIPSGSMENTLDIGDRVLINKIAYDIGSIHRGDVVVFNGAGSWDGPAPAPSGNLITRFFSGLGGLIGISHGQDDYVKRVIGLPGDRVACCDAKGRVTVNGVPLSESGYLYPGNPPSMSSFNVVVPPGRLWVMGDHRSDSSDSRGHMGFSPGQGTIPESAVLGQVFVRIWPPSRWGFIGIPGTFGQPRLNSALGTAIDRGNLRAEPVGPQVPLLLGFAGAVPITLLTRRLRRKQRLLGRRGPDPRFTGGGERRSGDSPRGYTANCHDPDSSPSHPATSGLHPQAKRRARGL